MRQQIVRFRLQKELGDKEMNAETKRERDSERKNANETETGSKLLIEYWEQTLKAYRELF